MEDWNENSPMNAEELGDKFEGDIELPPAENGRSFIRGSLSKWANGIVPYVLKGNFSEFGIRKSAGIFLINSSL